MKFRTNEIVPSSGRSPSHEIRLIVTADDLGIGEERDDGIFEAHGSGIVQAASLLVNGDNAVQAAKKALECGLALGLHLNLSEGPAVSDSSKVKSLLTWQRAHWCGSPASNGGALEFRGRYEFIDALTKGQVSLEEVATEVAAQLEKFRALLGYTPAHLDGHQHTHVLPGVAAVVARVAARFGVRCVRIPAEPRCGDAPHGPGQ